VNNTLLRAYTKERKEGYQMTIQGSWRSYRATAVTAFHAAKTKLAFHDVECGEHDEPELGSVRLRIVPDECVSFDDLEGDTFNPKVNKDVPHARLEREQKEFREKVNREGVWGVIGEYWDGEDWQHVDSCFGFVGDDWKESGYDIDIMRATLDAMKAKLAEVIE
jgi:hypothetical protein